MDGLFFQEKGYHLLRAILSIINQWFIHDYEKIVHSGQWLISSCRIPSLYTNYSQYLHGLNIKKSIFNLNFDSPVTFAAFEAHIPSLELWLNLGCGGGCLKTILDTPSTGNLQPRLQQISINNEEHLINALGLPGKGIDQFLITLQQSPIVNTQHPLGLSIGGHSLDEYKTVAKKICTSNILTTIKQPYLEINISCPNTDTGKSLHDNIPEIESLITHIRTLTDTVIVIKVSPDASDNNLCDIASLATQHNYVTINAGNTQYKMCTDVNLKPSAISIGGGGLSGASLYPRTIDMAKLLAQFKLPLIATGGICNAEQIIELQNYGVQVIGMATQLVKNPFSIVRVNQTLHNKNN